MSTPDSNEPKIIESEVVASEFADQPGTPNEEPEIIDKLSRVARSLALVSAIGVAFDLFSCASQFALPDNENLILYSLLWGAHALYGAVIFVGAMLIRRRQAYGWAITASYLGLAPCLGPLGFFAIPFALQCLAMLRKAEVKAAFE